MAVEILTGDCRDILARLPSASVNCVVTSPPYFGLRDYDVEGQMGLEATPDEFIAGIVDVFREVRRVLRDDGTIWLVLGDTYAGSGRGGNPTRKSSTLQGGHSSQEASMIRRARGKGEIGSTARDAAVTQRGSRLPAGLHEQQRQAGAIGRAWVPPPAGLKQKDLIGIPWMVAFALRADGWFLRQDIIWSKPNPMPESVADRCTKAHEYMFLLSKSRRYYFDAEAIAEAASRPEGPGQKSHKGATAYASGDQRARTKEGLTRIGARSTRNKRSVWNVATSPFKEAHFATFPPALIEDCILAGCPKGGTVLDPFGGAGTTGLVAERLGRNALLIELNPGYVEIARRRIGLFASVS